MICSLSGEACDEPVASTKTGHVYEKRIILKYLDSNNGKDPHSESTLSLEDLIPLKASKVLRPRPATATSIPGMLALFQNEWDALMLETFELKQNLDNVRQELSQALYEHDAACRVIARLVKERDEARNALANSRSTSGSHNTTNEPSGMEVENQNSLNDQVKSKITTKAGELSAGRRKRERSADLASPEDIQSWIPISSNLLHKTTAPGINCMDVHPSNSNLVVTGGEDTNVLLFDRSTSKNAGTLSGHSKPVNRVVFNPTQNIIFSASKDKTAKVWRSKGAAYDLEFTVETHSQDVTGVCGHPTGDYLITSSADATWGFHDLGTTKTLLQVDGGCPLSAIDIHPDGVLLSAGGQDSVIKIWDIKTLKVAGTLQGHSQGTISSIAFSENGYYMASAAGNVVKLWDLKKLQNIHTFTMEGGPVSQVSWDYSGSYLAAAGDTIKIVSKTFEEISTLNKHSKSVTGIKWGENAQSLGSVSLDRSLKFYAVKDKKAKK